MEGLGLEFESARSGWLVLSIVAAALVVWWTYRRTWPPVGTGYRAILLTLRLAVVMLAGVLLFEPVVKVTSRISRPERIAVLVDRSASMLLPFTGRGGDTAETRLQKTRNMLQEAGNSPNIDLFAFGASLSEPDSLKELLQGVEDRTDLASALSALSARGASWDRVCILTDGCINSGAEPDPKMLPGAPRVEAVLVGEPVEAPDLALAGLTQQGRAYEGGRIELRLTVALTGGAGAPPQSAVADIFRDGRKVAEQRITLGSGSRFVESTLKIEAGEEGQHLIRAELRGLPGEWTTVNNERLLLAEVAKSKHKLLLVTNSPDWDFTFLGRALAANPDWEVKKLVILRTESGSPKIRSQEADGSFAESALPDSKVLDGLELVALHGDFTRYERSLFDRLARRAVSGGFALVLWPTGEIDPALLTAGFKPYLPFRNLGLKLTPQSLPESPARILTADRYNILALPGSKPADDLPPLTEAYPPVPLRPDAVVLAQAGGGPSKQPGFPALVVHPVDGARVATVLARGLWRWHMMPQSLAESRDSRYYRLWESTIQWLLEGRRSSELALAPERSVFSRGAKVRLSGYLEPGKPGQGEARPRRVSLQVHPRDSVDGEKKPPIMTYEAVPDEQGAVVFDLGRLSPGVYDYQAEATPAGRGEQRQAEVSGSFAVELYSWEMARSGPDSLLLARLAGSTGGKLVLPGKEPARNSLVVPRQITDTAKQEYRLTYLWWVYVLIVSLLTLEWILRTRKALA